MLGPNGSVGEHARDVGEKQADTEWRRRNPIEQLVWVLTRLNTIPSTTEIRGYVKLLVGSWISWPAERTASIADVDELVGEICILEFFVDSIVCSQILAHKKHELLIIWEVGAVGGHVSYALKMPKYPYRLSRSCVMRKHGTEMHLKGYKPLEPPGRSRTLLLLI